LIHFGVSCERREQRERVDGAVKHAYVAAAAVTLEAAVVAAARPPSQKVLFNSRKKGMEISYIRHAFPLLFMKEKVF